MCCPLVVFKDTTVKFNQHRSRAKKSWHICKSREVHRLRHWKDKGGKTSVFYYQRVSNLNIKLKDISKTYCYIWWFLEPIRDKVTQMLLLWNYNTYTRFLQNWGILIDLLIYSPILTFSDMRCFSFVIPDRRETDRDSSMQFASDFVGIFYLKLHFTYYYHYYNNIIMPLDVAKSKKNKLQPENYNMLDFFFTIRNSSTVPFQNTVVKTSSAVPHEDRCRINISHTQFR